MASGTQTSTRPATQAAAQQPELTASRQKVAGTPPNENEAIKEPTPWQQLRAPFPAEKVGKLPRATVDREKYKTLPKARCNDCGGWHPSASTIHLDFVGHADVTDRLLAVDPNWNWEPMANDESGLPKFVVVNSRPVGLWIRLTVCGVTRLGYGSCDPGKGDAEKELIGDALRNSAMRFGVGLDLWRKERPHVEEEDGQRTADRPAPASQQAQPPQAATAGWSDPQRGKLQRLFNALPQAPDAWLWEQLQKQPYEMALAALTKKHQEQCWGDPPAADKRERCESQHLMGTGQRTTVGPSARLSDR